MSHILSINDHNIDVIQTFSRVFGPSSSQQEIFDDTVESLVDKFLRRENCVFFAYGMTNAEKTYSIQGTPQDPGIIPILTSKILRSTAGFDERTLQISMVEIYNDNVYDLSIKPKPRLKVRDVNGRVELCQLSMNTVSSAQEAIRLFERAAANRFCLHKRRLTVIKIFTYSCVCYSLKMIFCNIRNCR